jgi:hypothetical protein
VKTLLECPEDAIAPPEYLRGVAAKRFKQQLAKERGYDSNIQANRNAPDRSGSFDGAEGEEADTYNLTPAFPDLPSGLKSSRVIGNQLPLDVLAEHTNMDKSQLRALHNALSKEVSVIQGMYCYALYCYTLYCYALYTNDYLRDPRAAWHGQDVCWPKGDAAADAKRDRKASA